MEKFGYVVMGGVFIFLYIKYLLSVYCIRCCGGCRDELVMCFVLGCIDFYSFNCGCEGKGICC